MSEGFLSRWSRRKEAVRVGKPVEPEPTPAPPAVPPAAPPVAAATPPVPAATQPAPPPTLEDVQDLTPEADFSRFVQPDVAPEVKTAALKKLFADPHFNVMDGLDIYIDDYTKADPIPPAMLRSLASGRFLGLFEEEQEKKRAAAAAAADPVREVADARPLQSVAQSVPTDGTNPAVPPAQPHADPDLRLQQDDAAGPEGPGQRTG